MVQLAVTFTFTFQKITRDRKYLNCKELDQVNLQIHYKNCGSSSSNEGGTNYREGLKEKQLVL
jgi:hypothetical protein